MIRGIFCHDLPMYKDINGVYCSTTMTDDLFRRYFHVVDELIIATRVYQLNMTYNEAHQERITLPNIRFIDFPNLNKPSALFKQIPQAQKRLVEEIKNVDLIFIRGGLLAKLGVNAAKKLRKPYLIECAGCAWDTYWNHSLLGKLVAPYAEYRAIRDVRDASFVIYVTEKWLQKKYSTNGISTYASNVILTEVSETALTTRLEKLKDKRDVIVFGTTAGINNKAKGQQFVIQAMNILKDKYNIRYELVGGGDNTYLKSTAEKYGMAGRVIFKGQLNHDQVLKWLDTIDVYIQPSMQEGLPRALIEAMSRACPAIGSTTAGIPELLDTNAIFKRGNIRSLVSVIEQFMTVDWKYQSRRNFERAKEYQLPLLNARREKIYEQYRDYVLGKDE